MANCIILTGGTWNPDGWCKIKRHLGAYRVATALEEVGYSTFVLDYIEHFTSEEIIEVLSKHLGDDTLWVGFSSTFFWRQKEYTTVLTADDTLDEMYYAKYHDINKVIEFVKSKSKAKIVYGGSKSPYFCLDDVDKNIDYYVNGYADVSAINLTKFIDGKEELLDLTGKVVDSLKYPEPDVNNVPTNWEGRSVLPKEALPIELARGCIFKCKFCNYHLIGKKKGTYLRPFDHVKDEMIKNWELYGTESYYLTDDTFNDDNDKLETLHKVFTSLPFKPKFSCYLRLDLINKYPHQADLLTEMGLIGNFFGIETLQPESARAIGKGLHPSKVKDRLYWLHEKWKGKVNMEAGFILGLPYDTMQYFNDLLMWSMSDDNPLQSIHYYPLMLFHYKQEELKPYSSEFSLNPEIYGYQLDNVCKWNLPSQNLDYDKCLDISNKFNILRRPMNKMAGFYMLTGLNTGIELDDMYNLTQNKIEKKYDIPSLNNSKVQQYKGLIRL